MGIIICDYCDECLPLVPTAFDDHVCDKEDILTKIKYLENRANIAERRVDKIQDAARKVISEVGSLSGYGTTIKTQVLKDLFDTVECSNYDDKTVWHFHSKWMATHRVLCEAFDLFRKFKQGNINHYPTLLEKLTILFGACLEAADTCGYDRTSLDMTPEQLLAEQYKLLYKDWQQV